MLISDVWGLLEQNFLQSVCTSCHSTTGNKALNDEN